jgi:hypothetical protein
MALRTGEEDSISLTLPQGFRCLLSRQGLASYEKLSYPARFGRFHEISGHGLTVQFNLRAQPVFFQATHASWPHPHDWIKLTPSGSMLYLSSGSYLDVFSLYGEHFIPVPSAPSNSLFPHDPFGIPEVKDSVNRIDVWMESLVSALETCTVTPARIFCEALKRAIHNRTHRAATFHRAVHGTVPVLPPDTRHVNYDVIPLLISDGCLSNCGFCTIKTAAPFRERSRDEIKEQAKNTVNFLGPDLNNFNSVFLGQNDALACSPSLLEYAVSLAFSTFQIERSWLKNPSLFLFASVHSLLNADKTAFTALQNSGFRCYINIGFESFHQPTLDMLRKPARVSDVQRAFKKALDINSRFSNIEITGNFVIGTSLHRRHNEMLAAVLQQPYAARNLPASSITVYLSPLAGDREDARRILRMARDLQQQSRVPCFLYLLAGL